MNVFLLDLLVGNVEIKSNPTHTLKARLVWESASAIYNKNEKKEQ